MTSVDEEVQLQLENVRVAARAVEEAARAFHLAIVSARGAGASAIDVGEAAGLSRARVYQIEERERGLGS